MVSKIYRELIQKTLRLFSYQTNSETGLPLQKKILKKLTFQRYLTRENARIGHSAIDNRNVNYYKPRDLRYDIQLQEHAATCKALNSKSTIGTCF